MQKKEIKRKKSNGTNSKIVSGTKRTSSRNRKSKNDQNIQIVCWVGFVALTLLCYLKLGLFFAILTAFGIGVIVFISQLLKKYKKYGCKVTIEQINQDTWEVIEDE